MTLRSSRLNLINISLNQDNALLIDILSGEGSFDVMSSFLSALRLSNVDGLSEEESTGICQLTQSCDHGRERG